MSEEMRDFSEFAEKPLVFPINGKKYEVPPVGIETGLILSGAILGTDKTMSKQSPEELWKLLLGPVWDEMIADGVPLHAATRVGMTALADFTYNREAALFTWEVGEDPKALADYMQAQAPNRASRRSQSTGTANTTKPRASTKATTSRKR